MAQFHASPPSALSLEKFFWLSQMAALRFGIEEMRVGLASPRTVVTIAGSKDLGGGGTFGGPGFTITPENRKLTELRLADFKLQLRQARAKYREVLRRERSTSQ